MVNKTRQTWYRRNTVFGGKPTPADREGLSRYLREGQQVGAAQQPSGAARLRGNPPHRATLQRSVAFFLEQWFRGPRRGHLDAPIA
eukprot:2374272-Pyramimonas_sp.AAC.2